MLDKHLIQKIYLPIDKTPNVLAWVKSQTSFFRMLKILTMYSSLDKEYSYSPEHETSLGKLIVSLYKQLTSLKKLSCQENEIQEAFLCSKQETLAAICSESIQKNFVNLALLALKKSYYPLKILTKNHNNTLLDAIAQSDEVKKNIERSIKSDMYTKQDDEFLKKLHQKNIISSVVLFQHSNNLTDYSKKAVSTDDLKQVILTFSTNWKEALSLLKERNELTPNFKAMVKTTFTERKNVSKMIVENDYMILWKNGISFDSHQTNLFTDTIMGGVSLETALLQEKQFTQQHFDYILKTYTYIVKIQNARASGKCIYPLLLQLQSHIATKKHKTRDVTPTKYSDCINLLCNFTIHKIYGGDRINGTTIVTRDGSYMQMFCESTSGPYISAQKKSYRIPFGAIDIRDIEKSIMALKKSSSTEPYYHAPNGSHWPTHLVTSAHTTISPRTMSLHNALIPWNLPKKFI
jgi:hypothetical protein